MTKKILINKEGWVRSPLVQDAIIPYEVDQEVFKKISTTKIGYNWKLIDGKFNELPLITADSIRQLRNVECFALIDNKSMLWYLNLTKEQQEELNNWYLEWLDAPSSLKIPTMPTWLKK